MHTADWRERRRYRAARSGPPPDEVGAVGLSSFLLARTAEVAVAVRAITAYSDGLELSVAVLFADEQRADDLSWQLRDYSRSPGCFRLGVVFPDGRRASAGGRDAPDVHPDHKDAPILVPLGSAASALLWTGSYWLTPLPPPGPLVVGCRWPDRGLAETALQVDATSLLEAAASAAAVWEDS